MGHMPPMWEWVAAASSVAFALIAWRVHAQRMEAFARACHELRGALTAARLGLTAPAAELSVDRARAIDLELGRATLALDDLARVRRRRRAAPPRIERVDVRQLLVDSVGAWRPFALARRVHLRLRWSGDAAYVWGDRLRLAQATGNLIANAIEHGGGEVEVWGRAEQHTVRVEVKDGGRGLPAPVAVLARRARAGRGQRGRGLAIACSIAQDHHGRLAAAPSDHGARLVLELPASSGAPARAPVAG